MGSRHKAKVNFAVALTALLFSVAVHYGTAVFWSSAIRWSFIWLYLGDISFAHCDVLLCKVQKRS